MKRALLLPAAGLTWLTLSGPAQAGSFDGRGEYHLDPGAVVALDFSEAPGRYLPDDAHAECKPQAFTAESADDALDGTGLLRVAVVQNCAERLLVPLPAAQASYRATVWMRHGGVDASLIINYVTGSGLDTTAAAMFPTGRTTSDGWVELTTNPFPVDGPKMERAYLRVTTFAHQDGVQLDALEVVAEGTFKAQQACEGRSDPACSEDEVCTNNRCVPGQLSVPPVPADVFKNDVVDVLASQLKVYYGGRRSRALYLPEALALMESMRAEKSPHRFWNAWATAIHALHDWHTFTGKGPGLFTGSRHRLNACFFEGDADLSHGAWPKDPRYADILVSHAGPGAGGLVPGDRLVAVDGVHPMEWAAKLRDLDWGYHVATDPDIVSDYAEALGGPSWTGGALIQRFATTITVLRCDAVKGTCAAIPEVIAVTSLPDGDGMSPDVACDNRPFYHLEAGQNPDPAKHYIFGDFFRGRVVDSTPEQAIYGMVWDTLYGGGDPNGWVNGHLNDAIAAWKQDARGVILDHRAGNGGTLDAASLLTTLVRPPGTVAVTRMPMEVSGTPLPADPAAAAAVFDAQKGTASAYRVGANGFAVLPVALIIHRDGSASDYLPFGIKGAPRVRIFGPHPTSGAFSTFINFTYWSGLSLQLASGDTVAPGGEALIGHGVAPDVTLLPRQSDLLAGKDTLFEAALTWVKQEIGP